MIGTLSLILNFANPALTLEVPTNPTLIAYEKVQLQDRNRQSKRFVRVAPVVSPALFSEYKGLKIPAATLNRALDPANHVPEGFHFDPASIGKIDFKVTEPFLISRGITEVIGVGVSNFAGSTPNRITNIMRGLEDYDGKIIEQGQTFSFNENLSEIEEGNGFAWAKTILSGKDRWGLGGGICQVSTNVFRAALNAGLPVNERRAHSYHMSKYSPAGLDATIYKGIQDLKFVNDTPGDVMLRVVRRDNHLAVFLLGTRDRQVILEKTSNWRGFDGRLATHWQRTVRRDALVISEDFGSNYSGSY